jgi:regulator of RNase E activity RraB
MKELKKKLLSVCTLVVFITLAMGSAVNKIHMDAFKMGNKVEDMNDRRNYLEKNDGTRVYGKKIIWQSGFLTKQKISIDKQDYKFSEIKGFRTEDKYYGISDGEYIPRVVHGKLNVYLKKTEHYIVGSNPKTSFNYYLQKGDNGAMIIMVKNDDLKKAVADCPLAASMIDKSNKQLRKSIRKDHNFLNSVFDVYNNDCKPVN